jgi:hypothetical protein
MASDWAYNNLRPIAGSELMMLGSAVVLLLHLNIAQLRATVCVVVIRMIEQETTWSA